MNQETESTNPTNVSIVVPVYNEANRIAETLEKLLEFLDAAPGETFEILVADDGSVDATAEIAEATAADRDNVRVIRLPHGGKARAVLAGLRQTSGNIVGFMDADLATPLSTFGPALESLRNGTDVVIASREGAGSSRIGEPWYRHAMGRVFNGIVRLTLLPAIQDSQCGFKFMTCDARDRILPQMRLYASHAEVSQPRVTAFDVELLYIARVLGMSVKVIPVTWQYGNHSKVNPVRDTLQNVQDVLKVWVNGKRGLYRG